MKTFIIRTISGETRTIEAERYEVNHTAGCVDFFDGQDNKIKSPLFLVYGLELIEESLPESEKPGDLAMTA